MENKFFTFLHPFLHWLDSGKFFRDPFKWLYTLLAVLNLLFPIYMLYQIFGKNMLEGAPGKIYFAVIVIWIILAFACWLGFQLWWKRKDQVIGTSREEDHFVAIPTLTHFVQTAGEYAGLMVGVVGFFASFALVLIVGSESGSDYGYGSDMSASMLIHALGLEKIMAASFLGMLLLPLYGFLIIVVSRMIAELYRALAEIANNTRPLKAAKVEKPCTCTEPTHSTPASDVDTEMLP